MLLVIERTYICWGQLCVFLKFMRRGFNWNYSSFPIWTFVIKRQLEDEIRVSLFNSVNSAIILQYGNNEKNVSYINNNTNCNFGYIFNCFQMFLWTCKRKKCRSLSGTLSIDNLQDKAGCQKYKAWFTKLQILNLGYKYKAWVK